MVHPVLSHSCYADSRTSKAARRMGEGLVVPPLALSESDCCTGDC